MILYHCLINMTCYLLADALIIWFSSLQFELYVYHITMFYQRMLKLTWRDKCTYVSILDQLKFNRELFGNIVKRKLTFSAIQ